MDRNSSAKKVRFLFYDDQAINIILQDEKPSGGAAVQAHGWMQGLLSGGHEVSLITDLPREGIIKEECKNIQLHPAFDPEKGIRWIRWIYYRFPYIYKKVKRIQPDYLYQGIPSWHSFILAIICKKLRIKFIQRISNDFLLDSRMNKSFSFMERYFQRLGIKHSYCVLCQNDYQLNIIRKEFPEKKAIKISNPFFMPVNNGKHETLRKAFIAWVGLFQYQKNLKLLYEIAVTLPHEEFVIAGKESRYIDEESLFFLGKLKLLPNVKFAGFLNRKQIIPFLAKARFLLNTSHYEGFSNTFLEAMAAGTPIISSEKVNPDFIISDFGLGLVYKNSKDLKDKFDSLTPDAWEIMSQNCLGYLSEHHDYKKLAVDLLDFLEPDTFRN